MQCSPLSKQSSAGKSGMARGGIVDDNEMPKGKRVKVSIEPAAKSGEHDPEHPPWYSAQSNPQGTDGSSNSYNGTGGFGGGGRGGNPMGCGNNQHSPGAGGGFSGGGATTTCYYAGGAGGSYNTGSNQANTPGIQTGDGLISIVYLGN